MNLIEEKTNEIEEQIEKVSKEEIDSLTEKFKNRLKISKNKNTMFLAEKIENLQPYYDYTWEEGMCYDYTYGWDMHMLGRQTTMSLYASDKYEYEDESWDIEVLSELIEEKEGFFIEYDEMEKVYDEMKKCLEELWEEISDFTKKYYIRVV